MSETDTALPTGGCEVICEAGTIEEDGPCDPCGTTTRVCTDDGCGRSVWFCAGECALWSLPEGASAWEGTRDEDIDGPAPQDVVQATFAAAADRLLYVLTASEVYTLDTEAKVWARLGAREELLPEVAGAMITSAVSRNGGLLAGEDPSASETVVVYGDTTRWTYVLDTIGGSAELVSETSCCADVDGWDGRLAPAAGDLRAAWFDPTNSQGWVEVDLGGCEELMSPTPMSEHEAYILDDNTIRLRDTGPCGAFMASVDFNAYSPFGLEHAPYPTTIGGIAYADGLYVLRAAFE